MPDFHHWAHREHNDGTDRDVTKSARSPRHPAAPDYQNPSLHANRAAIRSRNIMDLSQARAKCDTATKPSSPHVHKGAHE